MREFIRGLKSMIIDVRYSFLDVMIILALTSLIAKF